MTSSTTRMVGRPIRFIGVSSRIRPRAAVTADWLGQQATKRRRGSRLVGAIRKWYPRKSKPSPGVLRSTMRVLAAASLQAQLGEQAPERGLCGLGPIAGSTTDHQASSAYADWRIMPTVA